MQNQVLTFIVFILNGFLIGLLFDIFRVLRKNFKTPDSITYLQDILFWLLSGIMIIFTIIKFNNGEIRMFIFLGIFLGFSVYMLLFSKLFIKVSTYILNFFKKTFNVIIIIPLTNIAAFLRKYIWKPSLDVLKKIVKQMKKMFNKCKNKKDFVWICRII